MFLKWIFNKVCIILDLNIVESGTKSLLNNIFIFHQVFANLQWFNFELCCRDVEVPSKTPQSDSPDLDCGH